MVVSTNLPALRTLYGQLRSPRHFSDEQLKSLQPEEETLLFEECWQNHVSDWELRRGQADPCNLWTTFFRVAEEFLFKRAQVSSRSRYSGRGRFPTFVLQLAVGASRPVQHGDAQTTRREGMLRKLARQIDPFLG